LFASHAPNVIQQFAVYLALGARTNVVDGFDQQIDQVINEGAAT
jgi:hypothetical protein